MQGLVMAAMLTLAVGARTDTTFTVSPGATLELENYAGSIEVTTWSRNSVRIEASHGRRAVLDIRRDDDVVQIEVESRYGTPTSADFKLTVPTAMALKLSGVYCDIQVTGTKGSVELETVQGDVEVTGGDGHISAQSVQGMVRVDGASGRIEVASVNEGVEVLNARGELTVESVNGTVMVKNARVSSLEASTVNGTIVFDGEYQKAGRYEMSTHNGNIYVAVPAAADLTIEAATYSGAFEATFPVAKEPEERRRKRYVIKLGNGSAEMNIESFQGTIQLFRPGEKVYEESSVHDPDREKSKAKSKAKSGGGDEEEEQDEE
jgi:DUF4097 and DUF4098 domain-containing protein YvlB